MHPALLYQGHTAPPEQHKAHVEALARGWPETNTNARCIVFEVDGWGNWAVHTTLLWGLPGR